MTGVDTSRIWLPLRGKSEFDALPLFCFPHAGGGASAFRTWLGSVPGVDALPVQPPGREARMRETPYELMQPLVDEVATVVTDTAAGRPVALYGHSLGALIAFETARELRRRGDPEPVHLVVSGANAPQKSKDHGRRVSALPQPKLVEVLRKLGGTAEWLLSDPELLQMILPAIRADFSLRENYRYRSEPPLASPITVLASDKDSRAPHRLQSRWRDQTASTFTLHTLTGGHFAIFEQPEHTRRYLVEALRTGR